MHLGLRVSSIFSLNVSSPSSSSSSSSLLWRLRAARDEDREPKVSLDSTASVPLRGCPLAPRPLCCSLPYRRQHREKWALSFAVQGRRDGARRKNCLDGAVNMLDYSRATQKSENQVTSHQPKLQKINNTSQPISCRFLANL